MRELRQRTGAARLLDGAFAPLHAVGERPLTEANAGIPEQEAKPVLRLRGVVERLERAKAAREPAQRVGVVAFGLAHEALLQAEACDAVRVAADEFARVPVGVVCVGVVGAQHQQVAERLPRSPDLCARERREHRRDGQRAPQELGRVDVRELRLGPFAREHGVGPRLRRLVGEHEVQREQLGDVSPCPASRAKHFRHTRVQLAAPPEREPFVGGVADQGVAEPERLRPCAGRARRTPSAGPTTPSRAPPPGRLREPARRGRPRTSLRARTPSGGGRGRRARGCRFASSRPRGRSPASSRPRGPARASRRRARARRAGCRRNAR